VSGSNVDMFRAMFFEEAGELLATLEQGLTALLSAAQVGQAMVDPVYRAAHSLKGAAAMVGLGAISEPALAIEKSLSSIRSGSTSWTDELGRSLIADRDRLARLVASEEARFRETQG
jgi:two-component system chemotaxis sensor kinase CheA